MKVAIMNPLDRSNYFRGLLLLVRKDHVIADAETKLMKRIGKALGFEERFCKDAIRDALDNKYLVDKPPMFSTKELAMKFIKDGLTVAASDNFIHPLEEKWLISAVKKNGLDVRWYYHEREKTMREIGRRPQLEAEGMN
jgi:hypothetical protein